MATIKRGFRIESTNIAVVQGLIAQFRPAARELLKGSICAHVARRIVDDVDQRVTGIRQDDPNKSPYWEAYGEVNNRHQAVRASGVEDSHLDHNVSLSLFTVGSITIGMFHVHDGCSAVGAVDLWMALVGVTDYSYWPAEVGPRPESVNNEDWAARGAVWAGVDIEGAPLGETGLLVEVFGHGPIPPPPLSTVRQAVAQHSFIERKERLGFEHFVSQRMAALGQTDEEVRPLAQQIWDADQAGGGEIMHSFNAHNPPLIELTNDVIRYGPSGEPTGEDPNPPPPVQ